MAHYETNIMGSDHKFLEWNDKYSSSITKDKYCFVINFALCVLGPEIKCLFIFLWVAIKRKLKTSSQKCLKLSAHLPWCGRPSWYSCLQCWPLLPPFRQRAFSKHDLSLYFPKAFSNSLVLQRSRVRSLRPCKIIHWPIPPHHLYHRLGVASFCYERLKNKYLDSVYF